MSKSIQELFLEAVIYAEPDQLEGNVFVRKEAYQSYKMGLALLRKFKERGLCDFEYDSIKEPYFQHSIFVTWRLDKNGFMEADAKELAALIQKFDSINLDEQEPFTWLLSSVIYEEAKDEE